MSASNNQNPLLESRFTALVARATPSGVRPLFWQSFGYAILPLRLFLGFTFIFAGLQKLANPNFFNPKSPISIEAQIVAYQRFSPLHLLLHDVEPIAGLVGLFIALSELAVGCGVFFGVLPRLAALGGMMISLTLFLSVSFHSNPYYTGSDIVFLFAMSPIAIAGTCGVFSLPTFLRRRFGLPSEIVVASGFQMIQQTCGFFDQGKCNAMRGEPCVVRSCPVLLETPGDQIELTVPDGKSANRREFLTQVSAVGAIGAIGLASGGSVAFLGRNFKGPDPIPPNSLSASKPVSGSSTSSTTTTVPTNSALPVEVLPTGAKEIGLVSDLSVGKIASFIDPVTKSPAYIQRPLNDQFVAFSAICPHAGCTVQYNSNGTFVCPCHGSTFNAKTGAVEIGPAQVGLTAIPISISSGKIFADPPK